MSQHLKALRVAGLVAEGPAGRRVHYRATPEGLAPLAGWFDHYGPFWRSRLTDLANGCNKLDPKE